MKANSLKKNIKESKDFNENESVGARAIMELRLNLGMTQSELAKTIVTPTSQIARYDGLVNKPSTRILEELAQANNKRLVIKFVDKDEDYDTEIEKAYHKGFYEGINSLKE